MRKCIIYRKRLFPGSITHMKWHVFLFFESEGGEISFFSLSRFHSHDIMKLIYCFHVCKHKCAQKFHVVRYRFIVKHKKKNLHIY
jgi:hypothetical protein